MASRGGSKDKIEPKLSIHLCKFFFAVAECCRFSKMSCEMDHGLFKCVTVPLWRLDPWRIGRTI